MRACLLVHNPDVRVLFAYELTVEEGAIVYPGLFIKRELLRPEVSKKCSGVSGNWVSQKGGESIEDEGWGGGSQGTYLCRPDCSSSGFPNQRRALFGLMFRKIGLVQGRSNRPKDEGGEGGVAHERARARVGSFEVG